MTDSEKLQSLKLQIKTLDQKKVSLNDAAEIKVINKQINALQMEYGRSKGQRRNEKAFLESIEREFNGINSND